MTAQIFRKRPVEIEAMQWDGDPWGSRCGELINWTEHEHENEFGRTVIGLWFMALPSDDADDCLGPGHARERTERGYTAVVWDHLHGTWVNVSTGDWIIKGIEGEFYPCRPDVFSETYELVPA